jgi:hypothetical protein
MTELRLLLRLLRHGALLWRSGQIRFRLETYGLYYPARPYEAPAWRVSLRSARLLIEGAHAYARWLAEMDEVAAHGPAGWWSRHRGIPREP